MLDSEATYGSSEQAGLWSINLGPLDTSSPAVLNNVVDAVTRAFWSAFKDVCSLEWAEGDIVEISDDGLIQGAWGEVPLQDDGDSRFRPATNSGVGDLAGRAVLS